MTLDLDAVNAALRFGDRFFPPAGTRCIICASRFDGFDKVWLKGEVLGIAPSQYRDIRRDLRGDLPLEIPETSNIRLRLIRIEKKIPSDRPTSLKPGRVIIASLFELSEILYVPDASMSFQEWMRL